MKDKLVNINQSLKNAVEVINNSPAGFSFVVDDSNKLVAMLTDGDVRRKLLDGFGLNHKLSDLNLKICVFAYEHEDETNVINKMNGSIRVIPIVNDSLEIIDYYQFDKRTRIPIAEPRLDGNELSYLTDALLSTWISSAGKYINEFEDKFSSYIGTNHGIAVSNGTTAIHLALEALGIGKGDEVIVPGFTFAATINAVIHAGAKPVVVDINNDSWGINTNEVQKAITKNTKAIIAVHIYGQPCEIDSLIEITQNNNLFLIEDAAEAHGAEYRGQKVGSFGDISTFSFFANKIITTGEGGMCLTNSDSLNRKMRQLRDHGMNPNKRYWHDLVGYNYRMTNMQAAIGVAQLERIDSIIKSRDELEEKYKAIFKKYPFIKTQSIIPNTRKVIWLVSFLFEIKNKNELIQLFKSKGIDVRPFFYPLCDMDIYKKYRFGNHSVSNKISSMGLSFPTIKKVDFDLLKEVLDSFSPEYS